MEGNVDEHIKIIKSAIALICLHYWTQDLLLFSLWRTFSLYIDSSTKKLGKTIKRYKEMWSGSNPVFEEKKKWN